MSEIMKLCGTRNLTEATWDASKWVDMAIYALNQGGIANAEECLIQATKRIDAIREEIKAK